MVVHRLLSSVIRSNDDKDWPIHFLMLPLHCLRGLPLRGLPAIVPCCIMFDGNTGYWPTISCWKVSFSNNIRAYGDKKITFQETLAYVLSLQITVELSQFRQEALVV